MNISNQLFTNPRFSSFLTQIPQNSWNTNGKKCLSLYQRQNYHPNDISSLQLVFTFASSNTNRLNDGSPLVAFINLQAFSHWWRGNLLCAIVLKTMEIFSVINISKIFFKKMAWVSFLLGMLNSAFLHSAYTDENPSEKNKLISKSVSIQLALDAHSREIWKKPVTQFTRRQSSRPEYRTSC